MPVTSADVARAAGVSRTTVSYVLNDTPGVSVSESTRERVRDVAAHLGYAPSAAARALRRGQSDLVVCVLPDWPAGPVVDTLLDLLTDALARRGLFLLVHHHRSSRPLRDLWRAVTPHIVVGLADLPADDLRVLAQAGIDVVGIAASTSDAPSIDPQSQHDIAALQVDRLASTGRRRTAVATTPDPRLAQFAELRVEGIAKACAAHGVDLHGIVPVAADVPATAAVRAWAEAGVDAVACYNDEVAFAVLAGAREAGVAVPEQIAVVGVDDVPAAALVSPALTTVLQPVAEQAAHLAACVLAVLDGTEQPPWPGAARSRIVVRDSA